MDILTANMTGRHRSASSGFTMIEMMAVMVIMAMMMAVAVAAYIDWGRGAGMRGSVLNTQSAINLARQYAVTHRARTFFVYDNNPPAAPDYPNRGYYYAATGKVGSLKPVTVTNYVSEGVKFEMKSDSPKMIEFKLDGSALIHKQGGGTDGTLIWKVYLTEMDRATPLTEEITITPLTGRCMVEMDTAGGGGGGPPGGGGGPRR